MSGERAHRIFSIEEANRLVPTLNEIFAVVQSERAAIDDLMPDIQRAAERRRQGGGSVFGARYIEALERISSQLERVAELGIQIKDVDQGLCDFPYRHRGKVVLLCWQYGEDEIGWWHDLDSGFRGRRPLSDLSGP